MTPLGLRIETFSFVVFFAVSFGFVPILNQSSSVPKVFFLVMGTLIMCFTQRFNFLPLNVPGILLIILTFYYLILQIFKTNNLNSFLFGSAGRGEGFISVVCFTIIFVLIGNSNSSLTKIFLITYLLTLVFLLSFGLLQASNLLPFDYSTNFGALILTLDNPNISSAYLGIALLVLTLLILETKKRKMNIIYLILFAITLIELFMTRSIQGMVITLVGFIIYLWSKYLKVLKGLGLKFLVPLIASITLMIIIFYDWFIVNASVMQRISYWVLGKNIFFDNFMFGIGLDNLYNFSPRYRSIELAQQEGLFTVVDRSHNIIIDTFISGGLFGGLLWSGFLFLITKIAITNIMNRNLTSITIYDHIMNYMWIGYLGQSLISQGHIALSLLGFISGSFVVRNKYLVILKAKNETI